MKNCLLFILLSLAKISFSQEPEVFYQTSDKEYAFKFEGNFCMLYKLSRYDNRVYQEWELEPVSKAESQADSLGILFSDGQYAVSYDYKYFRVCKLRNGKVKDRRTYVAKKLEDPSNVYEAINHSYWDAIYRNTITDIRSDFPLFGEYRYRSYHSGNFSLWESLSFKQETPKAFEILANERSVQLKDSLLQTNKGLISLNDSVEKNLNTLTLEALKSNLLSRPLHTSAYDEYQEVMLRTIAEKRPDLFFDLAEAIPTEKEYLFNQIYSSDAVKSLKKFDTDAPIKKEYLKYRRKERLKGGLIMSGVVLLQTGVIGGAITGIVFWIRK